jgi:hypothetical protein
VGRWQFSQLHELASKSAKFADLTVDASSLYLLAAPSTRFEMILADYRCGCTWVGNRRECLEYCGKHGEPRRRLHRAI